MIIILYSFGDFDLNPIIKDLSRNHPKHIFKLGSKIPTNAKFRMGFFRKQPIFNAELILDNLEMGQKKNEMRYIFTQHILSVDKSITSPLYAGLCRDKSLIMSTARLANYETILTVAEHELGHLFGLDHCENENCIMIEGLHDKEVVASLYWCDYCRSQLK